MEGVMMRNGDRLSVAVRKTDGEIHVETWPWFSLTKKAWLKKPFVRGFPVLLETMVNGIKALNYSAAQAVDEEEDGELKPWHIALTLVFAIGLALGLFVVVPHLFSLGMKHLGLGSDAEGLSFHVWDGFFKLAVFLSYIYAISLVPAIKRVFQYHGAEHKLIWTYEETKQVDPVKAKGFSRLHPRCGTAFLLFVLSISIVLHTVLVPLMLYVYSPENSILKHAYIIVVKLLLMVPIACLGYEAIRVAGKYCHTLWGKLISAPGLMLQRLTTGEPDAEQLEVAAAALTGALGGELEPEEAADMDAATPEKVVEPAAQGAETV
ncbi:MAG: DUF1385 domain-containing protein [Desulfovibrio sp.]|nr:MAG: DUF1385 domain-containing protein [Desulfovibrio sp.]